MRWHIRWQLLLPPCTMLVAVVAMSVWLAFVSAAQARRQIEGRVRAVAQNLSEASSYPLSDNVLRQMQRLSGADFLFVPDEGVAESTLAKHPPLPLTEHRADRWESIVLGPPIKLLDNTYFCSSLHLARPGQRSGTLYILYPESQWREARWEAMWPILLGGASAGLASVGLAAALGSRLSRRIAELERRTRLIAAGDFSPMPLPDRDDEIRDLARSVNDMARHLAQLQDTARRTERLRLLGQVSGGLAHQMRNGIAGARLALQLFAAELPADLDAAAVNVALRQLHLLEVHLKRFLELGSDGKPHELCNLDDLVRDAIELLQPRCRHAQIALDYQNNASTAELSGDASQLSQLILNLLTNAAEAAGPGGWVRIELNRVDAGYQFAIRDSGSGPPDAIADRLFEPFTTGKPDGIGLGLAAAQRVAEAHGGRIDWVREPNCTCFRVILPATIAAEPTQEPLAVPVRA